MGRPKLPQTKEQIAIRLAPGTKARLAALIRTMQAKGIDVPLRSEVLRTAIERGIDAMEGDLASGGRPARDLTRDQPAAPAASAPARTRPVPPPPHMPVPSVARPMPASRVEPATGRTVASPSRAQERPEAPRTVGSPPSRAQERPAAPPAAAPGKSPSAVAAPTTASMRRGPIPGTLADRTLRHLRDMSASSGDVPVPALCRKAWPPNPSRVHEALRELREMNLIQLVASKTGVDDSDHELMLTDSSGARFAIARLR